MPRTKRLDRALLVAALLAAAFGVVMVASASAPLAREYYHLPGSEFALRQLTAVGLGVLAMLAAMLVPLDWLLDRRVALAALGLTWIALLAAFLQEPVAGTHRWLALPFGSLQPSAVAKVTLPLALAALLGRRGQAAPADTWAPWAVPLALAGGTALVVLLEPDLGSAVLLLVAAATILLVAGMPWRRMTVIAALAAPILLLAIALKPYRLERVRSYFGSTSYQVHQSLVALGRGGLLGQGPGESVQKLFYLPQPHTDFIFAIVGEEVGFVGAASLLGLLGVVAWRGLAAAERAARPCQALLATGLATTLAVQTLLNVSVCLNLLPAKGLPLPLVSSGGSDVMLSLASVGLLLNIAKEAA